MRSNVVFAKRLRSYRPRRIPDEDREMLQGALATLLRDVGMYDKCWVCEEEIANPKRRKRWYQHARNKFGKKEARLAYRKSGQDGYPKSLRYALAIVHGEVWNVPVCCDGCQRMASLLYEEKKEWLLQAHEWLERAREQLMGLKKFLKTGDREALQSLQAVSRPVETLPL